MRQFRWVVAILAAAVTASISSAQPQPTGGPPSPSFGQYLNLINRGGSPALNYFGIVQPQLQLAQQQAQLANNQRVLNQNFQQLNQDVQANEYGIYGQSVFGTNRNLRRTGFIPSFGNTGHYFNTNPALGGAGGRAGGAGGGSSGQIGGRPPFAGAVGSGVPSSGVGMGAMGAMGAMGGGMRR